MVDGEHHTATIWKWHALGRTLLGWHVWNYSGKGPKWICWGCKKYHRGPLYSNQEPSVDPTYGVTRGKPPQTWETFEWKWLCMDCVRRLGYIW